MEEFSIFSLFIIFRLAQKQTVAPERYDGLAMHILMAAYFAHLLARTVYLSVKYRTTVIPS